MPWTCSTSVRQGDRAMNDAMTPSVEAVLAEAGECIRASPFDLEAADQRDLFTCLSINGRVEPHRLAGPIARPMELAADMVCRKALGHPQKLRGKRYVERVVAGTDRHQVGELQHCVQQHRMDDVRSAVACGGRQFGLGPGGFARGGNAAEDLERRSQATAPFPERSVEVRAIDPAGIVRRWCRAAPCWPHLWRRSPACAHAQGPRTVTTLSPVEQAQPVVLDDGLQSALLIGSQDDCLGELDICE